ncbi:MAG: dethiobiotin synthase [Terriglobales bacterium]
MPESRGIFVTGTDTGVGKTVVAAALVRLGAWYWKPIQSGIEGDPATDTAAVARWTGAPERMLPEAYRLSLPASPHVSAAAEGVTIERGRLELPLHAGPIVVEGAGGIMVPINGSDTMLDLMTWLALPVLLVARTQLGTINHTLLSLEALRRRGLEVRALVLNGTPVPSTTATLRAWGNPEHLIELPPLGAMNEAAVRRAGEALRGIL